MWLEAGLEMSTRIREGVQHVQNSDPYCIME